MLCQSQPPAHTIPERQVHALPHNVQAVVVIVPFIARCVIRAFSASSCAQLIHRSDTIWTLAGLADVRESEQMTYLVRNRNLRVGWDLVIYGNDAVDPSRESSVYRTVCLARRTVVAKRLDNIEICPAAAVSAVRAESRI